MPSLTISEFRTLVAMTAPIALNPQSELAVKLLEILVNEMPDDPLYVGELGKQLTNLGRPHEAIPHLEKAVQLSPNGASIQNKLGLCLQRVGRTSDSIPYFQNAVNLERKNPLFRANLSNALRSNHRLEEALEQAEMAVSMNHPNKALPKIILAHCLFELGRTEEAITLAHQTAKNHPDSAEALNNLGKYLLTTDQCAEALPYLETAHQMIAHETISYNLGTTHKTLRNSKPALFYFREAFALATQTGNTEIIDKIRNKIADYLTPEPSCAPA